MSNIEWKEDSVCFATGTQWDSDNDFSDALNCKDFQLNTIKQGDYIEASELDDEQKYDDAVEVFGLFGFPRWEGCSFYECKSEILLVDSDGDLTGQDELCDECQRKITLNQLMAIGELKRLEIKRDNEPQFGKNEDGSMKLIKSNFSANPNSCEDEWTDKHYNNFYQLTEEDIKAGQVKIDAYFVNRMWKVNQWDDTGAAFHVLKTLPRIANNKNPLKRELVALKKQVDLLCKMHGVEDANTN